ncbi:MAG: TatD family hydrolase [Chloroflexi bacterium]|nr:TatD family hydrolase [Chloroflexota bacterium]
MSTATTFQVIDTHAHLDDIENAAGAIESARQAGLIAAIAVGTGYESNHAVLDLAARHRGFVFAALGLHPSELTKELPRLDSSLQFIEDNLGSAVAIGEVGLDYHKRVLALARKDAQQSVLRDLLAIASKHDRPVSLHTRYAWKDSLALAREAGLSKVVFHWFTGFSSTLQDLIASGHFISATPAAEYHEEHRRAVREAPLDRLLLETDCPVEYGRGEARWRSEPGDIVRSLRAVAAARGLDPATVAAETTRNAMGLFKLEGIMVGQA